MDDLPSDTIRNKVYELTNNLTPIEGKINAILNFTQKDIFYLDYGLIDPKKPEMVIKQGFGDCKSKSLLTIKMLECIGVHAWPVIVKNTGLDERLSNTYSVQIFNHCVVEFVHDNDTIVFDPTSEPQKGTIHQKYVPNFRYGIRIIKNNIKLSKLKEYSYQKMNLTATISESNINSMNKVNWKLNFEGNLANRNNFLFNEKGINELFKTVSTEIVKLSYLEPYNSELNYKQNDLEPISELHIKPLNEIQVFEGDGHSQFIPRPLYGWLKVVESYKLGRYFSLPEFQETSHLFKFKFSSWMDFHSDSTIFENDWIRYSKKTWKERDTIYALYTAKILKADLDLLRYNKVIEDIELLKKDMELDFGKSGDKLKRNLPVIIFVSLTFLIVFSLTFTIWKLYKNKREHKKVVAKLNTEIESLRSQ